MYAENEILGNIKCLLMPGYLLSISLLTPGLTVVFLKFLRVPYSIEMKLEQFSDEAFL